MNIREKFIDIFGNEVIVRYDYVEKNSGVVNYYTLEKIEENTYCRWNGQCIEDSMMFDTVAFDLLHSSSIDKWNDMIVLQYINKGVTMELLDLDIESEILDENVYDDQMSLYHLNKIIKELK